MSTEQITNETYDQIAANYAERYWPLSLDEMLERFADVVKPGGQVLDLGCGPGRDVQLLNNRGFNTIGFDRSVGMLKEAQRRVRNRFVCADMRQIPLPADSFDGIWMCASLLHIPRAEVLTVLDEARRILRLQGALYISVRQGEGDEWSDSDGGWRFFTLFQVDELLDFVKQAKFVIAHYSVDAFGHSTWISVLSVRDE